MQVLDKDTTSTILSFLPNLRHRLVCKKWSQIYFFHQMRSSFGSAHLFPEKISPIILYHLQQMYNNDQRKLESVIVNKRLYAVIPLLYELSSKLLDSLCPNNDIYHLLFILHSPGEELFTKYYHVITAHSITKLLRGQTGIKINPDTNLEKLLARINSIPDMPKVSKCTSNNCNYLTHYAKKKCNLHRSYRF